jgi:hypothetical protein
MTLERFVTDYLEHQGALVEPVEPGVFQVLGGGHAEWPPEGQMARLVFDPEALPEHPDGVPVFFGTPRADEFLERGRALAPVARAFRADVPLVSYDLPARIRRALDTPDLSIEVGAPRARYDALALVLFRGTYEADEREDELHAAGVDLALKRPHRDLDSWWSSERLVDRRPLPLPDGPLMPLGSAVALAWQEVQPRFLAGRRSREDEARRRIDVELARMRDYFDEQLRDLESRRRAAPEGDARAWDDRRRATEAERARRTAELESKRLVRFESAAVSLLLIATPRLAAPCRLRSRASVSAPLEVVYDPAVEAVLPPACPACGRPTTAWRLAPPPVATRGREGLPVCPTCLDADLRSRARRR